MNWLRASVLVCLALALAAPGAASAKRKPPPPPPDSPGDCTFVFEVDVPDYLVLASIVLGVRCELATCEWVIERLMGPLGEWKEWTRIPGQLDADFSER